MDGGSRNCVHESGCPALIESYIGCGTEQSTGIAELSPKSALGSFLFAFLILSYFFLRIVAAQPGINDNWPAPLDSHPGVTYGTHLYWQGPIGVGQGFYMYVEDRNGARKSTLYTTDEPIYLLIQTPGGSFDARAWCIQYYPPNYRVRNWLFQNQALGGAGTFRLGGFTSSPGDPRGAYAFRVGILYRDSQNRWYWGDQVLYFTLSDAPTQVVTTTYTPSTTTPTPTGGPEVMGIVIVAAVVIIVVAVIVTRRPKTVPTPTTTSPATGAFCRSCGTRVPGDATFCHKCGAKTT